jgi:molybdenum cofactor cytidylyltransferase
MGSNKLLRRIDGMPLVRLAAEHALSACSRVIVVTGHDSPAVGAALAGLERTVIVHNPHFRDGMFGSIQAGMRAVVTEWFFVAPGDLPFLDDEIFLSVAEAGSAAHRSSADVVVPFYENTRGHPVLIRSALIDPLLKEDRSAGPMRALLARYAIRRVPIERDVVIRDIDTPEDFDRLS